MKKIALFVVALVMSVAANAQFEQGKGYLGASLTNVDLSYNGLNKGHFGLGAKAGYLIADDWMLLGQLDYQKTKDVPYSLTIGPGIRYYIQQNGLYMGASALFKHADDYNDFMPSIQIGYAFFISRTVTFEPEVYYEHSFKDHSNYSTAGIRLGVGVYLFKDQYKIKK
mgnify:CR=1 FL=1|jgi:hypothetical protein